MTLTPILPVAPAPASATESAPACGDGSRFQQTLTEVAGRYRTDGASRSGCVRPGHARTPAADDQSPADDGRADASGAAVGDTADPAPGAGPGPDALLLAQAGVVTGAPVTTLPTVPVQVPASAPVSEPAALTASAGAAGTISVPAALPAALPSALTAMPAATVGAPAPAGIAAARTPATTPSGDPSDPAGTSGTSPVASPAGDAPAPPSAAGAVPVAATAIPATAATATASGALPATASAGPEPAPASAAAPSPVAVATDAVAAPPGRAAVAVEPVGTSAGRRGAGNAPAGGTRPLRPGTPGSSAGVAGLSRTPTPSTDAEVGDADAPTAAAPASRTSLDAAPAGAPSEQAPSAPASAAAPGGTPAASAAVPAPASPASPASGAPGPATGGPETVPDQVLRHLESVRALRDGGHRTVLRLDPEHLGAVTVTVDVRAGAVRMAVTGGSEALAAVREGIAHLRSTLADAGLDLGDVALRPEGLQPAASTSSSGAAASPDGRDVPNGPRPDRGADGSTGDRRPGRQHDQGPPAAPERVDAVGRRPATAAPTAPPDPGHEPATTRRLDVRV